MDQGDCSSAQHLPPGMHYESVDAACCCELACPDQTPPGPPKAPHRRLQISANARLTRSRKLGTCLLRLMQVACLLRLMQVACLMQLKLVAPDLAAVEGWQLALG